MVIKDDIKIIILIRHGQTDASKERLLYGSKSKDEPINTEGINQIKRLTTFLQQYNPDTIYSSPMLRAVQTAEILVNTFKVQPILLEDLREIDFGDWEGRNFDKLTTIFPEEYKKWINSPQTFTPPNGESVKHLYLRVESAFKTILQNDSKTSFIITHGGPIRAILMKILNIPLSYYWRIKIPHGSATYIEYKNNQLSLQYMGQIGY